MLGLETLLSAFRRKSQRTPLDENMEKFAKESPLEAFNLGKEVGNPELMRRAGYNLLESHPELAVEAAHRCFPTDITLESRAGYAILSRDPEKALQIGTWRKERKLIQQSLEILIKQRDRLETYPGNYLLLHMHEGALIVGEGELLDNVRNIYVQFHLDDAFISQSTFFESKSEHSRNRRDKKIMELAAKKYLERADTEEKRVWHNLEKGYNAATLSGNRALIEAAGQGLLQSIGKDTNINFDYQTLYRIAQENNDKNLLRNLRQKILAEEPRLAFYVGLWKKDAELLKNAEHIWFEKDPKTAYESITSEIDEVQQKHPTFSHSMRELRYQFAKINPKEAYETSVEKKDEELKNWAIPLFAEVSPKEAYLLGHKLGDETLMDFARKPFALKHPIEAYNFGIDTNNKKWVNVGGDRMGWKDESELANIAALGAIESGTIQSILPKFKAKPRESPNYVGRHSE
jgi:hypothetical protein